MAGPGNAFIRGVWSIADVVLIGWMSAGVVGAHRSVVDAGDSRLLPIARHDFFRSLAGEGKNVGKSNLVLGGCDDAG